MGNDEDCTIEIREDCVVVALDGVRSEVHGREAVAGVKRVIATQLLSAIAAVPFHREQERERERYEKMTADRAYEHGLNPQASIGSIAGRGSDVARAIRNQRGF